MPVFIKERSKKLGLPPGSLIHIGEVRRDKVKIELMDYDETRFEERVLETVEECLPFMEKPTFTWINIVGVHLPELIGEVGEGFKIHPLVLEDILNTGQRPKMEDHEGYAFVVLRMLYFDEEERRLLTEQVSLILGENYLISFQESEADVFHMVRERIRRGKGRIRKESPDYLAYALMDAIVDNYFVVLEGFGEDIETLEEEILKRPSNETINTLHELKREMLFLRKSVWPLREVIASMERGESRLIRQSTVIFLRDVYDHTIQVMDTIETMREMLSGMIDIHLSSLSNKMNEVMKMLTIIATIFIPLTFIAGIYGMNFHYMPELGWRWGYPLVLAVMAGVGIWMINFFRKKKWL